MKAHFRERTHHLFKRFLKILAQQSQLSSQLRELNINIVTWRSVVRMRTTAVGVVTMGNVLSIAYVY